MRRARSLRIVVVGSIVTVLPMLTPVAWAQQTTVRLIAGNYAEIRGNAPARLVLGQSAPGATIPQGVVVSRNGGTVREICCDGSVNPQLQCEDDRRIRLGTRKQSVLAQYGASRLAGNSSSQLNYQGIAFTFDRADRVEKICIRR
jgi:hypothetical protein